MIYMLWSITEPSEQGSSNMVYQDIADEEKHVSFLVQYISEKCSCTAAIRGP